MRICTTYNFSYFESGTQVSDMLDLSQLHKLSIAKYSHREPTENCQAFKVQMDQIRHMATQIYQIISENAKQAENNLKV